MRTSLTFLLGVFALVLLLIGFWGHITQTLRKHAAQPQAIAVTATSQAVDAAPALVRSSGWAGKFVAAAEEQRNGSPRFPEGHFTVLSETMEEKKKNGHAVAPKPISSAFESTVVKIPVKAGESSITAEWGYTNHWDFPLAVEKFETSCGCQSGKADQSTLAPGQSGKLKAAFSPGQYRGLPPA